MAQNRPVHKEFLNIQSRLETFKKFPVSYKKIKTEALACAGFFFMPNENNYQSDQCICYSCGLNLYKWEPRDDPWDEHKKYNKNCEYILRHYKEKPNVQQLQDLYPPNFKSPLPYNEIYGKQAAPPGQQIMSPKETRAPANPLYHNKYISQKIIPTIPNPNELPSNSPQFPYDKPHTFPFQKNYQESSKHLSNITPSLQPNGYPSEMSTRNLAAMAESNKPEYNTQEFIKYQREKTQNSFIYVRHPSPQPGPYTHRDNAFIYSPNNINIPAQSQVPVYKLRSKQSEIQPNVSNISQMNTGSELPSSLKPLPGSPMPLSAHVESQIQDQRISTLQVRPGTNATPPNTGIYTPRLDGNQRPPPSPQLRHGAPAMHGNTYTQPQPGYSIQRPMLQPQYYTSGHTPYYQGGQI